MIRDFYALVRDGRATEFYSVAAGSPQLEGPEGTTQVKCATGFDPRWQNVDMGTGAIIDELDRLRAWQGERIDAAFEAAARADASAPGPAKALAHTAKLAEARDYLAGNSAGPMLSAEATDDTSVKALAKAIVAKADEAADGLAVREAARRGAKQQLRGTSDYAAAAAVADAFAASVGQ